MTSAGEVNAAPAARYGWVLALLMGALVAAPGLLPGAEQHLDNSPHALELHLLAREILPLDHWASGWSTRANAGTAVFQLNAPLAWLPLALLVQLGLNVEVAVRLGAPFANAVLALGAWALARRLFTAPGAALLAAALAATAPMDLVGLGGALGGMWPHRLANGVLLLGLAMAPERRRPTGVALWLAGICLLHTFTALFAVPLVLGRVALHLRDGQRRAALELLLALGLAGLLVSPHFGPLLDARLRSLPPPWEAPLAALANLVLLPVDVIQLREAGPGAVLGGLAGALQAALVWGGVALALRARPSGLRAPRTSTWLWAAVLLWTALTLGFQGGGVAGLGPNPWRHLAILRLALALTAAAGLASALPLLGRRAAVAVALTCGLAVGVQQVRTRLEPAVAGSLDALDRTWSQVARAYPGARVYQVDTFRRSDAPPGTDDIHPGGLEAARTGLSLVGSWYGVTTDPVADRFSSDRGLLLGAPEHELTDLPGWIDSRMRQVAATVFISHRAAHRAALDTDPRFVQVADTGVFTAWARTGPALPILGAAPPGDAGALSAERDRIEAQLSGAAPLSFRVRQAYHPWWEGSVDGRPVPLSMDPQTGLLQGEAPAAGHLVLIWRDRGQPWRWSGLLGLLLLGVVASRAPRGARLPK